FRVPALAGPMLQAISLMSGRTRVQYNARSADALDLHPLPTRRSSDLSPIPLVSPGGTLGSRVRRRSASRLRRSRELWSASGAYRSEEHTSELQSRENLVCGLLLERENVRTPVT